MLLPFLDEDLTGVVQGQIMPHQLHASRQEERRFLVAYIAYHTVNHTLVGKI